MVEPWIEYYQRKYGDDLHATFIHLVLEIGDLARGVERDQREFAVHEVTELAALIEFLAVYYDFDLRESMTALYSQKLEKLKRAQAQKT